jgi:hypothetical protein
MAALQDEVPPLLLGNGEYPHYTIFGQSQPNVPAVTSA